MAKNPPLVFYKKDFRRQIINVAALLLFGTGIYSGAQAATRLTEYTPIQQLPDPDREAIENQRKFGYSIAGLGALIFVFSNFSKSPYQKIRIADLEVHADVPVSDKDLRMKIRPGEALAPEEVKPKRGPGRPRKVRPEAARKRRAKAKKTRRKRG